jgi:Glycoside hydrolase family 44
MQTFVINRKSISFNISKLFAIILICFCESQLQGLRADQIIYDDTLENGFEDWGYATENYANTTPVHSGSDSISVTVGSGYQGIQIINPSGINDSGFTSLTFWLNGGSSGGQSLQAYGCLAIGGTGNVAQSPRVPLATPVANTWQQYTISLSSLGVANAANFSGFVIQSSINPAQPTFYLDDISLVSGAASNTPAQGTNAPISIVVNAQSNRLAISPLIYSVAFASQAQLSDLNVLVNRSGGNAETRYNWETNAHNRAADFYFESISDGSSTPGAYDDSFISSTKAAGAAPAITIPMIGWAPKLGAGAAKLASYSIAKYGPQTGSDSNYFPDAGDGVSVTNDTPITWNNPNDANIPVDVNFQKAWVQHLTNTWGLSTNGGVGYYLMDNEHSLWFSTHQDIHPIGPTMQEIYNDITNYAGMVKGLDPHALVLGPEEWGWNGYFYSGYDQQWSGQHGDFNPAHYPDRATNGGMDYMPWLLNQLHQHDMTTGVRLLDYFTLHCYPQEGSVSGNAIDPATELLRNQSTRQFWDTNYVDPSWINSVIDLIPRMKNWVATYYPGTKIGVTEYNWGAEAYISGGTAEADILGIFGRQGLDLATRWTVPAGGTPTYLAMKMYRNYDGNKSTFGDTSVLTTVPNPDDVSAFGAVRSSDGALTLMVVNKDITNASPFHATITNFTASGPAQRWQLTSTAVITQLTNLPVTNGILSDLLPFQSVTLYVLPGLAPFSLQKSASASAPGQVNLQLNGQSGLKYIVQSSPDLVVWAPYSTNTLVSNSLSFSVPTAGASAKFYRGMFIAP